MVQYVKTVFVRDGGFVFRISSDQVREVKAEIVSGPHDFKAISPYGIGRAILQGQDEFDLEIGIMIAVRQAKIALRSIVCNEIAKFRREKLAIFNQGRFPVRASRKSELRMRVQASKIVAEGSMKPLVSAAGGQMPPGLVSQA